MPKNMTIAEKMALTMQIYSFIFASRANGLDIITMKIIHPNIVNGQPILNGNMRVGGLVNGRWFKDSTTGQETIRGFDVDLQTDGKILQLRFLEQNPNKVDDNGNLKPMANAARRGSKIMWLINRKTQVDSFLGRVQDGRFFPSQDRAIVSVAKAAIVQTIPQYQSASQEPDNEEMEILEWNEDAIPDLPDGEIPDSVMQYYANMEPENETQFTEF